MPQTVDLLDPLSEMIALSTYGNTKNLIITVVELNGPVSEEAFVTAVHRAVEHFPRLKSRLRELKGTVMRRLAWEPRPDLEFPVHISSLSGAGATSLTLNAFLDHLAPRLERDWDLFQELPGEFHLVKIAPDHYLAGPVLHHAASDGVTASEFGRRILIEYHEVVTGEKHHALGDAFALSTSRKRMARPRKRTWKDLALSTAQSLIPYAPWPALPVGSGLPHDLGQHHIKRTISAEESQRVLGASLQKGLSFLDLMAACANTAVDRWNEARNVRPGVLTNSMTVNMKGRYRALENPNAGGVLFFTSRPEERTNITAFAKAISVDRIRQFRHQMDFIYYRNVTRLAKSFRMLSFGTRRRLFHYFLQKNRVSVGLTFLGVVWPKLKNGKPTSETGLTETGGLEITDVHALGYKLLSSTQLLIIVYLFRSRINIVLAASASLFTREEGEAFLDLVTQLLLDT